MSVASSSCSSCSSSSCSSSSSASSCLVLLLLVLLVILVVLAQLRPAIHSVLCRTSTTTTHAQLRSGREHWARMVVVEVRQGTLGVDGRGEVRQGTLGVDTRGVPCRTSTTTIHAQCSLPDLNREYPRQVFPAGPHVGRYGTKNVQKKVRKNVRKNVRRYARRYAR